MERDVRRGVGCLSRGFWSDVSCAGIALTTPGDSADSRLIDNGFSVALDLSGSISVEVGALFASLVRSDGAAGFNAVVAGTTPDSGTFNAGVLSS
jgi:hypothetical protein